MIHELKDLAAYFFCDPASGKGRLKKTRARHSIVGIAVDHLIRIFVIYQPARFFGMLAAVLFLSGFLIGLRFLYYFITGDGDGHVQSLILSGALLTMGFQTFLVAFLADVIAANRRLLEEIRYRQRADASDRSKV